MTAAAIALTVAGVVALLVSLLRTAVEQRNALRDELDNRDRAETEAASAKAEKTA